MGFTAGNSLPIKVEYWEGTGAASVNLQVKGPGLAASGQDVPSSWLSTTPPSLPTGWSLSADVDGSIAYRSAQVSTSALTFTDTEGTAHKYSWDATKSAWQPPAGEHGVASKDASGNITLVDEDGQTYSFSADGNLATVESGADDKHPAAQVMNWTGTPAKLTQITDPVSNRSINLAYSGSSTCSSASGFSSAPAGMLCAVDYSEFAGGTTQLRYNAAGSLTRIEDPGTEVTDFAYDANARLIQVRDPLASDALAAGIRSDPAADDSDPSLAAHPISTVITYDSAGRAATITQPEPQPGEARPAHTYSYTSSTATSVAAAGLTSTTGKLRQVTFDSLGRLAADTDQAGRTVHTAWDTGNNQIASWDDATGLKSTSVFDDLGRETDSWGPASTSWWTSASSGGAPTTNSASTPHKTTGYDQGISTLGATWWPNEKFSGPPAAHSTGINPSTGLIYNTWGTGAPAELGTTPPPRFSGRIVGWINIANTTPYDFRLSSLVGTARLYVDNTLVIDTVQTSATNVEATFTPTSTGWKPVTIEYADTGASAAFGWWWRQGTAAFARVPQPSIQPGYGLATTETDEDGHTVTTSYSDPDRHIDPYLAVATSMTTDPGAVPHANLTGTVKVEDPTVGGYLRETSHTLPTGDLSRVTSDYYEPGDVADVPCPGGATGVNQGGLLKSTTSADPDGIGGDAAIEHDTIYDASGRPAATHIYSDGANWVCTTYDARSRITSGTTPGLTGAAGRVETNDYAVSGNPLATANTDTVTGGTARTVTTIVDLLGRERSYTDAWGKTTTTTYDQVGRVTSTASPVGTETTTYDASGAEGPTVLDGVTLATPHYDSAGRLSWVEYANGTKSDAVSRDSLGRETSSTYRKSSDSSVLASETETLSLGGDVTDDVTDGNDPHPGSPDYVYDGAGRLTDAWTTVRDASGAVSSRHTAYGFGTASGSCAVGNQADAGKNSDRTSQTVGDGGSAVTTNYCYDAADRLVSSTESGIGTPAYDGHGNTTSLWGESRVYDASDRHSKTTKGSTTVTYERDGSDRLIQRTADDGLGSTDVERYGYTGDGDSADFTMDGSSSVVERTEGLPGGVAVTFRAGSLVWSYPNMHGDIVVATDGAGAKTGVTHTYDAFGNTTGQSIVDNSAGLMDYGWLGEQQRPVEHQADLALTVEMGARQYDPVLGRFLEVDPIEGGSANDYDYVNGDPVNGFDIDGTWWHPSHIYRHVTRRVIHGYRYANTWRHKTWRTWRRRTRGIRQYIGKHRRGLTQIFAIASAGACIAASGGLATAVCTYGAYASFAASTGNSWASNIRGRRHKRWGSFARSTALGAVATQMPYGSGSWRWGRAASQVAGSWLSGR
jgi:RHS repeat-associated protein